MGVKRRSALTGHIGNEQGESLPVAGSQACPWYERASADFKTSHRTSHILTMDGDSGGGWKVRGLLTVGLLSALENEVQGLGRWLRGLKCLLLFRGQKFGSLAPLSGSLHWSLPSTQGDLMPSSGLLEYCTHETYRMYMLTNL